MRQDKRIKTESDRLSKHGKESPPPYAAVCHFHRQVRRYHNGNYLESEELSGNMQIIPYSRFVQSMGVSCNGI